MLKAVDALDAAIVGSSGMAQRRAIAKAITLLESTRADHRAHADELLTALDRGLIQADRAQWALETTYRAVAGIAAHGHDAVRWLASQGTITTWRRR